MKTKFIILIVLFFSFQRINSQTHIITVHPNQRVVSFEMTPAEYSDWIENDEFNDDSKRTSLVKEIYQKFSDAFDFIFLVLNEESKPSTITYDGKSYSVSSDVTGIGIPIFNLGSDYGSDGKLKAVIALSQNTFIMNGPSLHELAHTWANFGIQTCSFSGTPIDNFIPHWGFTGGNTPGQLGGFLQSTLQVGIDENPNKYKVDPFGQATNGDNIVPYSELELYLMGMIASSEVTPFDVFRNITSADFTTYEFEANTRVTYDGSTITSELGDRSPSELTSQKNFRGLFVVLTGAPLVSADWDLYDSHSEWFGITSSDGDEGLYNFWEATLGKGTIETGNLNNALNPVEIILDVSPPTLTLGPGSGETGSFDITSNTSWTITDDGDWLTVNPTDGTGNTGVTVTASSENTSPAPRSAIVTISADDAPDQTTVTVTQTGTVILSVSPSSVSIEADSGSEGTFDITSNTSWTITDDGDWLTVNPTDGTGNTAVTVTASSENTSPAPRSAIVTISADDAPDQTTVTVTQTGTVILSASPSSVSIEADSGSEGTFDITSNTSWTITDDGDWLTVNPTDGTGNTAVTVTASSENTSPAPRSAIVTISADDAPDQTTVTVTQTGTVILSASPSSVSIEADSGSEGTFDITSNTTWTITDDGDWLTVNPTDGTGNTAVTVTASSENTSPAPRSAIVTISADDAPDQTTVTVTQTGTVILSASPSSVSIEADSGSEGTFDITSNTTWTITDDGDWLTVNPTDGTGNTAVTVTASSENTSPAPRSAIVTISADDAPDQTTVTVTQTGTVILSASPSSVSIEADSGSEGTFDITSNTTWTITDDGDWLTVNPTDGTGNTAVTVTASSENTSPAPRSAIVTISADDAPDQTTVTVTQEGLPIITQDINLTSGWNILSFSTEPDDMSMMAIVNPLIVEGTLIKVQDEKGGAIERLPDPIGWIDNIGQMSLSEGYKIKVAVDAQLSITGQPVTIPYNIPLEAGWNIAGYPFTTSQPAMPVFQPLISAGSLLKVQDELGNAIEELPAPIGWIDNINNLNPGDGYKIKTSVNTTLIITDPGKGDYFEGEAINVRPSHFNPVYTGNGLDHMNIYLKNPTADGSALKAGDEIGVFDGNRCVGATVINDLNLEFLPLIVSLDDPTTQEKDGFTEGNQFEFRVWNSHPGFESLPQKTELLKNYNIIFERSGTSVLTVDFKTPTDKILDDAFPNPSSDRTIFTFRVVMESKVRLEIADISGNLVKVLIDHTMPEGIHIIEWDNCSMAGRRVSAGLYFYRLRLNNFLQTKQLVVQ